MLYDFCRNCDGMQSCRFRWAHHGWSVLVQVSMITIEPSKFSVHLSTLIILSKRNSTRLFATDWRLNSTGAYATMIHRKISMKVHVFMVVHVGIISNNCQLEIDPFVLYRMNSSHIQICFDSVSELFTWGEKVYLTKASLSPKGII